MIEWLEVKGLRLVLTIALTAFALLIAGILARRVVGAYKHKHKDRELQKRAETLGSMFRYVLSTGVLVIALMLILELFGMKLGPMLAAAGVVGIAVGFGAQHLVQDITNGFFIMLDDEIREGDVVRIAGEWGTVERVGLRQTVLRNVDGNVHFIPNSKIDVVTNMTKTFSYCMLNVGVAYREDVDEVFDVIEQVSGNLQSDEPFSEWIEEEVEILGLDEFADSAMIIKARIKVEPLRQWKVRREFNRRLKKAFDERNIEIPFPHLTLYQGQGKDGSAAPLFVDSQTSGTGS
jgi:small conductance mechanosensitive channel